MDKSLVKRFYKYILGNIAGMIGVSAYVLADTFFISVAAGSLGIAVLNLALPLYGVIFAIGSMVGVGSATRYALKKAEGEEDTDRYFSNALCWQILIAIPFMILGIFAPRLWLIAMGGDGSIVELGVGYVKIVLIGTPVFMMNYSFTSFARNDNAPTIAMAAALIASGFNILFDYIFMFPLGMGIVGAALATALAPIVSIMVCCIHFCSRKSSIKLKIIPPSIVMLINSIKLGTAAFVGEIASAVTTTVFNFLLLAIAGNEGVAAYGVVANFSLVGMAIFNGLAQGMQPLISEEYGHNNKSGVGSILKRGLIITVIIEMLLLCLVWLFTEGLVAIFNSEGNAVMAAYAYDAMRLYFCGYIFAGVNVALITFFASIGEAFVSALASLLRGVLAISVFSIVLSQFLGMKGIWFSFLATELFTFGVILIMIKRKRFRKRD